MANAPKAPTTTPATPAPAAAPTPAPAVPAPEMKAATVAPDALAAAPTEAAEGGGEMLTAEEHAVDAETPDWLFASTKAYHGWAVGKQLSRGDYDAAVKVAAGCSTASLKDAKGNPTTGRVTKK